MHKIFVLTVVMQFVLNYKNLVISNPDLRVFSWYNMGAQHEIQGKIGSLRGLENVATYVAKKKNIKNILLNI